MSKDIELRNKCGKLTLVFGFILIITVIFKSCFFPTNPDTGFDLFIYIVVEVLIWLASGITASAFTLYLSKTYDYEQKKKNAITEYFYDAQTLFSKMLNLKPILNQNWDDATNTLLSFEPAYKIWQNMQHNYNSMHFTKSDQETKRIIDSINKEYRDLLGIIMVSIGSLKNDKTDESVKNCNSELFEITLRQGKRIYTPYVRTRLFPLLGELEKITTNNNYFTDIECPIFICSYYYSIE